MTDIYCFTNRNLHKVSTLYFLLFICLCHLNQFRVNNNTYPTAFLRYTILFYLDTLLKTKHCRRVSEVNFEAKTDAMHLKQTSAVTKTGSCEFVLFYFQTKLFIFLDNEFRAELVQSEVEGQKIVCTVFPRYMLPVPSD